MSKVINVLGIDPGLRNVGYALVSLSEDREVEQKLICAGEFCFESEPRMLNIYRTLKDLVSSLEVDFACLEKTFVNINPFCSMNLSQARGVALLVLQELGINYKEIAASRVKKTVTGSGCAKKKEIQSTVSKKFNVKLCHNAADAVAIALSYLSDNIIKEKKVKEKKIKLEEKPTKIKKKENTDLIVIEKKPTRNKKKKIQI